MVERFIAFRYFRAKRKEKFISFISVLNLAGVALGVAALIVVFSVLMGFQTTLINKMLGAESHVIVLEYGNYLNNWEELVKKIETVPGVKIAEPVVFGQVLLNSLENNSGAMVRGLNPTLSIKSGRFAEAKIEPQNALDSLINSIQDSDDNLPPVILGERLAANLGAYPGVAVKLVSPSGRITPLGGRVPLSREFLVVGTINTGLYDYDANFAYTSLFQAQSLFGMEGAVTGIEVRVDDFTTADKIKLDILEHIGDGYWAEDWTQLNQNFYHALNLEKMVMFVILTLIILVAAFNIVSTLIMVVMEKVKEVAILKTMGATNWQIRSIFMLQGLMIGFFGTLMGLIIGVGTCWSLEKYKFIKLPITAYGIDTLPVNMSFTYNIIVCVLAILMSLAATVYPSSYAAKLDPVEALRYE